MKNFFRIWVGLVALNTVLGIVSAIAGDFGEVYRYTCIVLALTFGFVLGQHHQAEKAVA